MCSEWFSSGGNFIRKTLRIIYAAQFSSAIDKMQPTAIVNFPNWQNSDSQSVGIGYAGIIIR